MMADQQTRKALHGIKGLSKAGREAIIDLGLPVYDSLVLAHLKVAGNLLAQDADFDWQMRDKAWREWKGDISHALDWALRYRRNDTLVVAVCIVAALFPALDLGAALIGYKMLDDVARFAQRSGTVNIKRERRVRRRTRIENRIVRCGLWLGDSGQLMHDRDVCNSGRVSLISQGYREVWGIEIAHREVKAAMPLVNAVIPVVWQAEGDTMLIAPKSGGTLR